MRTFTDRVGRSIGVLILFAAGVSSSGGQQAIEDLTKPHPCVIGQPVLRFDTAQAAGNFVFAVVGDTGRGCDKEPKQCALAADMEKVQEATGFKHLFLLGDNVYDWGSPDGIPEKIYQPYAGLARRNVLIKGVVGNHDVISQDGSELQMRFFTATDAAEQRDKFLAVPIEQQKKLKIVTPTWYNFVAADGVAEFFALDSSLITDDYVKTLFWKKKGSDAERAAQMKWFEEKLAASRAKWKIVILHHPMYSSADYHGVVEVDSAGNEIAEEVPKEMRILRTALAGKLSSHGVRLVLAGHDHGYEHIKPQGGVQYFVSGAGATVRAKDYNRTKRPFKRFANFHECGSVETSFMLFSVGRDQIDFWNIGIGRKVIDHGVIR